MAFEPIDVQASLNQMHIVDLAGLPVPPELIGKSGYDLLSAKALAALFQELAAQYPLATAGLHAGQVQSWFEQLPVKEAYKLGIAAGHRLGYLLLTLKTAGRLNRAARPQWGDAEWTHWQNIRQVWIGGGSAAGWLGEHLRSGAAEVLGRSGIKDCDVRRSEFGAQIGLVGMGRVLADATDTALVFDFGSSSAKRAIAYYAGGTLAALRPLPALPAPAEAREMLLDSSGRTRLFNWMSRLITSTCAEYAEDPKTLNIGACLACYLSDGQPLPLYEAGYYALRHLSDNLQQHLAEDLSQHLDGQIKLRLLHDGTAAASAYAGTPQAAVITLGTALGIGFPPPAEGVQPLAPELSFILPTT